MGDQPVPHDSGGHRGLVPKRRSVDCRSPQNPPEKIPTPPLEGGSDISSSGRRQSQWQDTIASYCPDILPSTPTRGTRLAGRRMISVGGAGEENNRTATTFSRSAGPGYLRSGSCGRAHGWKHPRAPSGKWLWKEKSTEAVLAYLGSARVGCISAGRRPPEDVDADGAEDGGEEGGPGPPNVSFPLFLPFWDEGIGCFFLC